MSKCKKCQNDIEWVKTRAGKNMPVDPTKITVVTKEGDVVTGQESHFSTCPYANDFRGTAS